MAEAQEETEGKTPPFCAVMAGKIELMVALLDDALEGGRSFNPTLRDCTTLLAYATQRPLAAFAIVLAPLAAGADRTGRPLRSGRCPERRGEPGPDGDLHSSQESGWSRVAPAASWQAPRVVLLIVSGLE